MARQEIATQKRETNIIPARIPYEEGRSFALDD